MKRCMAVRPDTAYLDGLLVVLPYLDMLGIVCTVGVSLKDTTLRVGVT